MAFGASAPVASAQLDDELAGESRVGRSWGEEARPTEPDDPLRIMAFLGAGVGFRPLRNLDPPFYQDFLAPAYVDLGAAVYLPGAEVRHGIGLTVTTAVSDDQRAGVELLTQWVLTPSYNLLIPLRRIIPDMQHDLVHIQAHIGVPVVLGSPIGTTDGVEWTIGGELGIAGHFKFLAGLGAYVELNAAVYGGVRDTIHPVLGAEAGFLFDYEVLP